MMEDTLRRNLRDVVKRQYGGSMTEASIQAGLNQDAVRRIIVNPNHTPDLKTLQKLCDTYGWSIFDAVCWVLDIPERSQGTPDQEIARGLRRKGLDHSAVESIMGLVRIVGDRQPQTAQ